MDLDTFLAVFCLAGAAILYAVLRLADEIVYLKYKWRKGGGAEWMN